MADGETSPPRRRWSLEWNLGLFPAFIIHLLLAWAVRVFDFLVLPLVASQPELLAVYAAVFHVLLVMLLWSYWKCVLALPMAVPQEVRSFPFSLPRTSLILCPTRRRHCTLPRHSLQL